MGSLLLQSELSQQNTPLCFARQRTIEGHQWNPSSHRECGQVAIGPLLGRDLVSIGVLSEEWVDPFGFLHESGPVCREKAIVNSPGAPLSEHVRTHRTRIGQQPEKAQLCEAAKQ